MSSKYVDGVITRGVAVDEVTDDGVVVDDRDRTFSFTRFRGPRRRQGCSFKQAMSRAKHG